MDAICGLATPDRSHSHRCCSHPQTGTQLARQSTAQLEAPMSPQTELLCCPLHILICESGTRGRMRLPRHGGVVPGTGVALGPGSRLLCHRNSSGSTEAFCRTRKMVAPATQATDMGLGTEGAWGLRFSGPENSAAVPLSVRSPRSNLPLLRPTKTEAPACLTWLACDVTERHSLVKATPKGGNALGLTAPEESVSGAGWGRLAASLPMSQASARWVSSPTLFGVWGGGDLQLNQNIT